MLKKFEFIKVGDFLMVIFYVPYFIKGKEYLIIRKFKGVCVKKSNSKIYLKTWQKGTLLSMSFDLNSVLLLDLYLLKVIKPLSIEKIKNLNLKKTI